MPRPADPAIVAAALEDIAAGLTYAEVGQKYGMSATWANKMAIKHGFRRNGIGGGDKRNPVPCRRCGLPTARAGGFCKSCRDHQPSVLFPCDVLSGGSWVLRRGVQVWVSDDEREAG